MLKTPKRRSLDRLFGVFSTLVLQPIKQLKVLISTSLRRKAILVIAILLVPGGVLYSSFNSPGVASAAPSTYLNFQARLLSSTGNLVPDGNYNIEFKLYNASSSSGSSQGSCTGDAACEWTETRTSGNTVTVKNGYFSVNLGSVTALGGSIDWSSQQWLTMNIGGTGAPTWDGEMTPRILLTAVPLAFVANNVNSGNTSAASTNSAATTIQSGNATGATSNTGNITLQSGNATSGNSGNLTIDAGTASGTKGTISLGATSASAITLGRSGITTTNGGALTVTQLLTANLGLTVSGAAISLNDSSNFNTSINGGSSTGTITVGNAAAGAVTVQSGSSIALNSSTLTTNASTISIFDTTATTVTALQASTSTIIGATTGSTYIRTPTFQVGNTGAASINGAGTAGLTVQSATQSAGSTNSGTVSFTSGFVTGATSNTGNVTLKSGNSNTSGNSGTVSITTGNATSGNSGNLTVDIGTASGTKGTITIGATNASALTLGRSGLTTTNSGSFTAAQLFTGQLGATISGASISLNDSSNFNTTINTGTSTGTVSIGNSAAGQITLQSGANIVLGTSDTTGTLLVLDTKTGAGDPTGVNGGMYYNSSAGKFRCYQASAWADCISGGSSSTLQNSYDADANGSDVRIDLTSTDGSLIFSNPSSGGSTSSYVLTVEQLATGAVGGLSIQSAGTGNLLLVTDTTATARDVLKVANGGATTLRNQTDSTAAFQIQSASAGTPVLTVDTTNSTTILRSGNDTKTLGSELYPTNNFATDWTNTNWDVSVPTQAAHNTGNTSALINTTVAITAGAYYQVSFDLSGGCGTSSDSISVTLGSTTVGPAAVINGDNCSGSYTYIAIPGNTAKLTFTPTTNWAGTISNISIKLLTGTINPALTVLNNSGGTSLEVRASSDTFSTFIGSGSGANNATGTQNTALGVSSLASNTGGSYNGAFGAGSLYSNTTGLGNNAFGYFSLFSNTTGTGNNAFGLSSLQSNTTGYDNSAFGSVALSANTTGYINTAIGSQALSNNTTGYENSAFGYQSLLANTTGHDNVAIGPLALGSIVSGVGNTAIGSGAGATDLYFQTRDVSFSTAIGALAQVQADYSIVLGESDITNLKVGIGNPVPQNFFSAGSMRYSGSLSGSSAAVTSGSPNVTGTGTTWDSTMIGNQFIFADGTSYIISAVPSGTSITLSTNATATETASDYRIFYIGLQVKNDGTVFTQGSSTSQFSVLGAAGTNLFGVDASNSRVLLGTSDTTGTLLVLDTKTGAGDPTGVNGGMYYNSNAGKFRCYQNSTWADCISGGSSSTLQNSYDADANGSDVRIDLTSTDGSLIFSNPSSGGSTSSYVLTVEQLATGAVGGLSIQSAGTGNLLLVTDTTATARDVLKVANGGATTLRNQTDSTAAFQIQSASAGTPVLTVDTTNSQTILRGINTEASIGADLRTGNCSGTNWSGTGAGPYTHSSGAGALTCTITGGVVAGATYEITYDTTGMGATDLVISGIGSTYVSVSYGVVSSFSNVITAFDTANPTFGIGPTTSTGSVTNITIKRVTTSKPTLTVQNSDGTTGLEVRSGGSGLQNTFIGISSGQANTTGTDNTANGYQALLTNISGSGNTANGSQALFNNTSGLANTANGQQALGSNVTGSGNTASGVQALGDNISGSSNTAFGYQALGDHSTGSLNTAIGYRAGAGDTDGFRPLDINSVPLNINNSTAIGYNSVAQASNSLILGSAGTDAVNVGIGTTIPTNTFSVSPTQYNGAALSLTASQTTTTVTGTGTTFTAAMVGGEIIWQDGSKATITGFTNATTLTASPSQTVVDQNFRIHYPGLQVTNAGNVGIGVTSSTSRLSVVQNGTSDGANLTLTNLSATQTNGLLINRNGTGGTTTNLLSLQNTAGTATNGILFTGTIGTDITTAAGSGAGAGRTLLVVAGQGGATGTGGGTTIKAGAGGSTSGSGGDLTLQGGAATAGNSAGGNVSILGGVATGTGAASTVTIASGIGMGTNISGGTLSINTGAGNGTGTGGTLFVQAGGGGATGNGGTLQLLGGNSGGGSGTGGLVTLQGGAGAGTNSSGGGLQLNGGTSSGTGVGGAVTIQGGAAQSGNGVGGNVTINGGVSTGTGAASTVTIASGAAAGATIAGGALTINSGAGNTSGAGGLITIQSGQGGATGTGGNATIKSGAGGSTSGGSGALILQSGDTTSGTAGNVTLDAGTSTSGTPNINIGGGTGSTITLGNTTLSTGTQTINIATGNTAGGTQNVNIGNGATATAGTVTVQAKTSVLIGNAVAPTITLQGGSAGTIGIGTNAIANTITIGATAINTGNTQSISLGALGAAGTTNVTIGSNASATAGTTTVQGKGLVTLQSLGSGLTIDTTVAGQTTQIANSGVTHTLQIATGAAIQTITIGSTNTTSKLTVTGGANSTTAGIGVQVGLTAADAVQVNLLLDTNNESGVAAETGSTCTATVNQGAMYYNSKSNSIRQCAGGNGWTETVTGDQLGLQLFGVVDDSVNATNPGDLASVVTAGSTGPCKVFWASTTTVSWNACTAYSAGRKVIVAAAASQAVTVTSGWSHICLSTANTRQPVATNGVNETTNLGTVSMASVTAPILCLADVSVNGTSITGIYDTRTFVSSHKEYATIATTAPALGMIVVGTATSGQSTVSSTTAGTGKIQGVVVATTGATATATINAIIVTAGSTWVKSISTITINDYFENGTTAGYAMTTGTAPTNAYATLGLARTAFANTCNASTNCSLSVLTYLNIK